MKKVLFLCALLLALGVVAPAWSAMVRVPVQTDNFDDNNLTSGSIVWTQVAPGSASCTNSGGVVTNPGDISECVIKPDGTYANNQYAKIAIASFQGGTTNYTGVACRVSTGINGARDFYLFLLNENSGGTNAPYELHYVSDGGFNLLASGTQSWSVGDTIEIECEGTTIRGMRNGVQVTSATDSNLTSGKPGVWFYDDLATLDNFEGGDLSAAAPAPPRRTLVGAGK